MGVDNIRKWRIFRKIAAISGIIQGLTWLILASICIGLYYGKSPKGFTKIQNVTLSEKNSYTELISFCFYDTLLYDRNNDEDRLLKPQNFQIFAWFYATLSACWLSFALFECIALFSRKTSKYEAHVLMLSGSITLLTCILDIIIMSFAFRDYFEINVFKYDFIVWDDTVTTTATDDPTSSLNDYLDLHLVIGEELSTGNEFVEHISSIFKKTIGRKIVYGILITLSTRGIMIWIFNCVSGILLLLLSLQVFQAPPILKYDNKGIPRAKIVSPASKDRNSLFGSVFAEDNNYMSTPPSKKRLSLPAGDRYGGEQSRNNPLALGNKNRRNENMFF